MQLTKALLAVALTSAGFVGVGLACSQAPGNVDIVLNGSAIPGTDDATVPGEEPDAGDAGPQWGPNGVTVPISIMSSGAPGGFVVSLAAQPSTIVVTPTTVTLDDHGNADAYAFIPYGTSGVIVLSGAGATATAVPVRGSPIILCTPDAQPAPSGDLGAAGQVYTVSVQALTTGSCDAANTKAPPSISLNLSLNQPSSTTTSSSSGGGNASSSGGGGGDSGGGTSNGSSGGGVSASTVLTADNGVATTNIIVPWGPDLVLQVTGGGGFTSAPIRGVASPVTVSCLYWKMIQAGIYQINAQAVAGGSVVPGASIGLSAVYPPSSGTVTPSTVLTNDAGMGTAFLAVPDADNLPVVVEAFVGTGALTTSIGATQSGDSGTCL